MNKSFLLIVSVLLWTISCGKSNKGAGVAENRHFTSDDPVIQVLIDSAESHDDFTINSTFAEQHPMEGKALQAILGLTQYGWNNDIDEEKIYKAADAIFNGYIKEAKIAKNGSLLQQMEIDDTVAHKLSAYETSMNSENSDYWDIRISSSLDAFIASYLNWKYNKLIADSIKLKAPMLDLKKEAALHDTVTVSIRSIYDYGDYGSSVGMIRSCIMEKAGREWTDYQKALLSAVDQDKEGKQYTKIEKSVFDKQLKMLLSSEKAAGSDDSKEIKKVFMNIYANFWKWMDYRENISKQLNGTLKAAYINQTNKFKRNMLIHIKNCFSECEEGPQDYFDAMLPEDCTDEELFKYTTFDEEYAKRSGDN